MDTAEFAPESTAETHRCESSGSCPPRREKKLAFNEQAKRVESIRRISILDLITSPNCAKKKKKDEEKGRRGVLADKVCFPARQPGNAHFEIAITSQLISGNLQLMYKFGITHGTW